MLDLAGVEGQASAVAHLQALLRTDRLPHALLLAGPDGVGKMRAARALAAVLLCGDRSSPDRACGRCPACAKVDAGTHADLTVVTTDARSIKVAEIREVERALRLRPLEGPRRVVIIEDAHRATVEAQNALLKTLEEPPSSAHLILTTSRMRRLLPTVVSRCPRIGFGPIPEETLAGLLRAEDDLDPDAARLLAALAHGSLGWARAAEADALVARRDRVAELDARLRPGVRGGATLAVQAAQDLAGDRAELAATLDIWLVWLRDQLIRAVDAPLAVASSDREPDLLRGAAAGPAEVAHRARAVLEARRQLDLPYNLNAQMIAEQLCLALCGYGRMVPVPA